VADLRCGAVVVELVYGPAPTPLMLATAAGGGVAIDGHEVLMVEVRRQFRLMTGRRMPAEPVSG
jgi:shikimate 5-dehydrogenase